MHRIDPPPTLPRPARALGLGLLAVLLWSTVATAFKLALQELSYLDLVFLSSLTSMAALTGIAVFQQGLSGFVHQARSELRRSALLGLVCPFAYYLVLFAAYERLPAQQAQALNYTWGVTLSLLAVPVLRQKLGRASLLGLVLCYGGVLLVTTRGDLGSFDSSSLPGVGLALFSTVLWSAYWLACAQRRADPAVGLALNFAFGAVYASIAALARGHLPQPTLRGAACAAYIGVVEMGVTFLIWLAALRHSDSTARIASLIYLSPFLSLFLIRFVLKEAILPTTYAGLTAIVAGVFLAQIKHSRSTAN